MARKPNASPTETAPRQELSVPPPNMQELSIGIIGMGPVDIGPGGKPDSPDFIAAPSEVEFDFGNETHKGEGVEVADTKEGRLYVFELTSRGYRLP